jgi:hypothetical protein
MTDILEAPRPRKAGVSFYLSPETNELIDKIKASVSRPVSRSRVVEAAIERLAKERGLLSDAA